MIRDEEVDAFFKLGDEGTYAGGPHSIAPVTREAEAQDDELAVGISTEQLERRDRMKRFVTTFVGTLGTAVMVLLPFKLGAFGGAAQKQSVTTKAPNAVIRPVVAAAAPLESRTPVAAAASPAPVAAAPVAPIRVDPVSTPVPLPSAPVHARAVLRTASAERSTSPMGPVAMRRVPSRVSAHTASPIRATRGAHVPPTASFPD